MVSAINQVFLAQTEATYGVTPTFTQGPVLFKEASWMPQEADAIVRTAIRPYMGNSPRKLMSPRARLQGTVYLTSSGVAGIAPPWRYFQRGCGMAEIATAGTKVEYTPVSVGFESMSVQFFLDNVGQAILGARGTWSLEMKAGDLPVIKYDINGFSTTTQGAGYGAATFTPWVDPLPFSADNSSSASLFGAGVIVRDFTYSHGATVAHRDLSGRKDTVITARAPSASITIELPATFTTNFVELSRGITTGSLSIQHGTVAGSIVEVVMNKVQILPDPKYSYEDNIVMLTLNLLPLPTSGDDEILIRAR